MNLSADGIRKIIEWETGGEREYDIHPEWPGEQSGITIGIGWDLGHTPSTDTTRAWRAHLDAATLAQLVGVSGRKGKDAQEVLPLVRHLVVPWAAAMAVFEAVTIPTWYLRMLRIYPQADALPGDCAAALLSLCFNRGISTVGDRRREMADIQRHLRDGRPEAIPSELRGMCRLWPDSKGLRRRRAEEAELFERGLAARGD